MLARAVLVILIVMSIHTPADARRGGIVVFNTGDDILHIRDLDAKETGEELAGYKLGYHYQRFGLFFLDVWRYEGEFCLYKDLTYIPLEDEQLDQIGGASTPWGYVLPPGLVVLLALFELFIMWKLRPTVRTTLIVTGVIGVIAIVFLIQGMQLQCGTLGILVLYHGLASLKAMRPNPDDEVVAEPEAAAEPTARPSKPTPAPPVQAPPRVETDPFRAPPAPPPIITTKAAPRAESEAPVKHDPDADEPSLLR